MNSEIKMLPPWLKVLTALLIFMLPDCIDCLRLEKVRIPNYVLKGSDPRLECNYDLEGDTLYSVKWYKDGNEFYRYLPREHPPAQTYRLPGFEVDLDKSSDVLVAIVNVSLYSAGNFRCEVSGEAPEFQTVTDGSDMVVALLPENRSPIILGSVARYRIGDWVNVNCTSGPAKPAVHLEWYVNDSPADPMSVQKYDSVKHSRDGLETATLGLHFRVEQHHFRHGDMKLKCIGSMFQFYSLSNEESVEGERPLKAPALESRDPVYASNSRADPMQGTSLRETFATKILSLFIDPNATSRADTIVVNQMANMLFSLVPIYIAFGYL